MSKEQLFDLIHHLQKEQPQHNYFTNMVYLTNCAIHLIIYFSFPAFSLANFPPVAPGFTGVVILLSFTLLLLLQIVLFLTKKQEIYLRNQLLFFRFVVSPIITMRLIQNASSSMFIPALAALGVVFVRCFSFFLSKFILYENDRHYSLNVQATSIIAQMQFVEFGIILSFFVTEQKIQFISALFMALFCYSIAHRYFKRMQNEESSYKILALINMMYLLMFVAYLGVLMFNLAGAGYFFSIFTPLILMAIYSIWRQRRLARDNIVLLLSKKLTYHQFIESVDGFLMILKQQAPSRKRIIANYIMAIFSAHEKGCNMPGCEIQTSSTKQELRSLSSKSIDQLTLKALKKLQWIFEQYHRKNADNVNISFALLKFYGQFLPNKAKMQNLLSDIQEQELGLAFECEYSKYKKICTGIQNVENIDVIKDEEIYLEFRNTMISTLNSMREFWNQFGEERVDLAKITAITAKLFPLKAKIQQIFGRELGREKFTTFRILKLYSSYTRRIMNRWKQAAKVEDFLQILAQRLKDKQDIQFLSKESEAGFVVICLSQSKLGNIFMVNQKACNLFRYAKKDILNLRVNAIMPTVIADIHDQILTDFLKKKRKKYNTDQRLLFGKDGNGFIFPIMLQLQRASFSANDEFIFIASVAPAKFKSAPNYCIVDQQGTITDLTSTFKAIFFGKSKKDFKKNIQQIIPSYFQQDYSEQSLKVRQFTFTINSNKLNGIQAFGQSSPLIVKGVHQGFLIKVQYNHEKTMTAYKNLCLTDNIKNLLFNRESKSFENLYQSNGNFFQIEGGRPHNIVDGFRKRQFTLPFLNYEDMAIFAKPLPEKKDYGRGIKIVRFVKNHFERIEDEDSFHSDTYKDHHQETLKQIEDMQSAKKKSESTLLIKIKVIAALAVFLSFLVLGLIHRRYATLRNDEQTARESLHGSKIIFVRLSEYIVCYTCQKSNIYPDFFGEIKGSLKKTLISSINEADLSEFYKQQMSRIIYLESSPILQQILNSSFNTVGNSKVLETNLDSLWGGALAIITFIICIFPFMFYQLKLILFQIYLLFIDIKDPVIKKIDSNCNGLINKIYLQIHQNVEREEEKRQIDLDQEGELQKKRRYKNTERSKDLYMLIKITVPLLMIIGLLLFALFFSRQKLGTYELLREQQQKILEVIPSASIQFMKMTLRVFDNITLSVSNNYEACFQELESTIMQFTQHTQRQVYLDYLYGDICSLNEELFLQLPFDCEQLASGVMTHGLSPTINFVAERLQNIKSTIQASELKILFLIQFFFVNPTIMHLEKQMSQALAEYLDSTSFLFQSLTIIISSCTALYYLYLILYPLNVIQQEITFTSEMITLVPESEKAVQEGTKSIAISQNNL